MQYEEIKLELSLSGVHVTTKGIDCIDEFFPWEDEERLLKVVNALNHVCDPEARFSLTDKGKKLTE
jgi:hypothetical protein